LVWELYVTTNFSASKIAGQLRVHPGTVAQDIRIGIQEGHVEARNRQNASRAKIYEMARTGQYTAQEIADATGVKITTVQNYLVDLKHLDGEAFIPLKNTRTKAAGTDARTERIFALADKGFQPKEIIAETKFPASAVYNTIHRLRQEGRLPAFVHNTSEAAQAEESSTSETPAED
jgi:hypothetical protein